MDTFLQHNSIHYPIGFVAMTQRNQTCEPAELEFCYGGCFLHELPAASDQYFRDFGARIAAAAEASGGRWNATPGTMIYFHPYHWSPLANYSDHIFFWNKILN